MAELGPCSYPDCSEQAVARVQIMSRPFNGGPPVPLSKETEVCGEHLYVMGWTLNHPEKVWPKEETRDG